MRGLIEAPSSRDVSESLLREQRSASAVQALARVCGIQVKDVPILVLAFEDRVIRSHCLSILKAAAAVWTAMECPACGGPVTMEVGPGHPPSASVADALLAAAEDEQIIVARNCWACGWGEERSVVIDSIETTEGNAEAVERAALLDNIRSEATAIDDLATLEDALAEVRRQRRLGTAASDSSEDGNGE